MKKTSIGVNLTLIGDAFDLNYVSDALNISPTYSRNTDEVLGNGRKFGHTEWGIGTAFEESVDIEIQLKKLLSMVEEKIELLNIVRIKCNAEWNILIVINVKNGNFPIMCFSKHFIKFADTIEAKVGFDMYLL